ncbi:HAD family hydrolase [Streptomyces scopuliridis]|uniref:HAD family hydrolase n=1 Tax=Streptomyces scopuliridis TaxID=452529 RepID=UPI00368287B6
MTIPSPGPRAYPQALVLDLFGTLVDAPTRAQRLQAAETIAVATAVPAAVIEQAYIDSWAERHDGRLPTLDSLSDHLWQRCGESTPTPQDLRTILLRLATARLSASPDVVAVLRTLRGRGLRIAVLSDASADIAEAWQDSALSESVDVAVFSCRAGAVKPHISLYRTVTGQLGVAPQDTMYCGDGGGDELRGATAAGLTPVRVERRGGSSTIAFGDKPWHGPSISGVEQLPAFMPASRAPRRPKEGNV